MRTWLVIKVWHGDGERQESAFAAGERTLVEAEVDRLNAEELARNPDKKDPYVYYMAGTVRTLQ